MIATSIGSSLEAESIELSSRKVNLGRPKNDPKLNCLVYPFKLNIDSKATIDIELTPKQPMIKVTSLLGAGDELHGETISGFSGKTLSPQLIQRSGGHKGKSCRTRRIGYAQIDIGVRALLQKKIPKKQP